MKIAILILLAAMLPAAVWAQTPAIVRSAALTVGETFTLQSKILGEAQPINVYVPPRDVEFVLETLFLEPDLFNIYIAFEPSLWWNRGELVKRAAERMPAIAARMVYFACGSDSEMVQLTRQLADAFAYDAPRNVAWRYETFPDETHATIYHSAALREFHYLFKP